MLKSEAPSEAQLVATEDGPRGDACSPSSERGSAAGWGPDNLTVDCAAGDDKAPNDEVPRGGDRGDCNKRPKEASVGNSFGTIWLLMVRAW